MLNKKFIVYLDYAFIFIAVVAFFMEVWMHAFTHGNGPAPIYGVYLFVAYSFFRLIIEQDILRVLFRLGYFWWLIIYGITLVINYVIMKVGFSYREPMLTDTFNMNLTSLALSFSLLILFIKPNRRKFGSILLLFALVFSCFNGVYDLFLLDDNYGFGSVLRGGGFYLNPNSMAVSILLGYLLIFQFSKRTTFTLLLGIILIGILSTLSRAGMVMFLVLFLLLLINRYLKIASLFFSIIFISFIGFFAYQSFITTSNYKEIIEKAKYNKGISERVEQVINPEKTKLGIREVVFKEHFNYYMESPILGNGLGSSTYFTKIQSHTRLSSHVQYLYYLNDFGPFGLLFWILLPFSMLLIDGKIKLFKPWFIFTVIFLIAGWQSHNLFDSYSLLFCYSFLGVSNLK